MCDPSRYRWHLTPADVGDLARHGHLIPITRGLTRTHLDEHYPGWTWNRISAVLKRAGVLTPAGGMLTGRAGVVVVHLVDADDPAADGPAACCVEWAAGFGPTSRD